MSAADQATRVEGSAMVPVDDLSAADSLSQSSGGLLDRLGRYVLLDRLGRGAFGAVWTAYDPQLDRRVAIKVVHARRRKREVEAGQIALLREAQLLAQVSHPNIVAIHDVGRLEDALASSSAEVEGEPLVGVFIVMEHLAGPSLAEWLAGSSLVVSRPSHSGLGQPEPRSARERSGEQGPRRKDAEILRVFGEAGRGLRAAHASDLVHLDFKPGNVMFGKDGRVRVLDFGLARVGRRVEHGTNERGRVAGTPAYMAPEQHEGKLADSRADQFAFCVSLWEALYGQRPFAGENSEELHAAKRAGPPKLSPATVRLPHVHAALERGLAVDPEQRFASMDELLAVLGDDPRLRRRRWIAGIALVGGLLGLGFGLARASDEQGDPCALPAGQFDQVWDAERRAAVEAAFLATGAPFADESFAAVAAALDERIADWTMVRREVCQATLVDAEVPVEQLSEQLLCLDRHLRSVAGLSEALTKADAEVVARARDSVLELEEPERCRSEVQSERAVVGAARRSALLEVEDSLARARVARELGRFESGKVAAERAVARASELGDLLGLARARREHARSLRELGQIEEARQESMAALAHAESELQSHILIDLIDVHTTLGEFAQALAIRQIVGARIDPVATPELAVAAHLKAATAHERQQHWDEALAELDTALALHESGIEIGAGQLAEVHLSYGNVLMGSARDLPRGMAEYRLAIELWSKAYGEHHPLVSRARMNLGAAQFRAGNYAEAIELIGSALVEFEQIYPDDHPLIGACHQNLGALQWVAGELRGALVHTGESLVLAEHKFGREHPDYASIERNFGSILVTLGQHREAAHHFSHAAEAYAASFEPDDTRQMAVSAELAELAWWFGDDEQARSRAKQVAAALEQAEPNDPRRMGPLSTLALFALHDGELERAEAHAREFVALAEVVLGLESPDLARARILLAEILNARGDRDQARGELELALAKLERKHGLHPFAWAAELELGRIAKAEGRPDEALEKLEHALALASGPEGAKVHAAIVELELAESLASADHEGAEQLRQGAFETLRGLGIRTDLVGVER